MQKSTIYWVAGGLALIGVLAFFKWEMSRDREATGAGNIVSNTTPPSLKETASNAPPAIGGITNKPVETQDFFGAALEVAKKTGERAGRILSNTNAPAGSAGTVSNLLDLAVDAGRELDQLGLEHTQMTDAEEIELGNKMQREILQELPEASDPQSQARLQRLAAPLIEQCKRKAIPYRIHIVRSSMINAFGSAGGHIYFTTAFLRRFTTDGELAMTLGHEIAHIDLKHAVRKVQYEYQSEKVVGGLAKIGQVVYGVLSLPYSREQEFDADAAGFDACRKAGWSSGSLLVLFDNLIRLEHDGQRKAEAVSGPPSDLERRLGDYFSSHPPTEERLARLKKRAAQ